MSICNLAHAIIRISYEIHTYSLGAKLELVTDKLFSAILDKSIRAQAFWQEIANNKTQKTNNNQIQNINDQKIAYL